MDYQPTIIDTVHIFLTNIQLYKHRVLPFNIFSSSFKPHAILLLPSHVQPINKRFELRKETKIQTKSFPHTHVQKYIHAHVSISVVPAIIILS